MTAGHIAVIDIGKTNAKLALVDVRTLGEIAVVTRPNIVQPGPPWPHFDVDGHWEFLLDALADFHAAHGVASISITTHGAAVALIGKDGTLAAPILDYEHAGPDEVAAEYDLIRPPFEETGSPKLAGGLNVGAQLFWQFRQDSGLKARTRHIVTYPQYWGYRLTGVAACDVTSLGCHTDLWNSHQRHASGLVERLGISELLAPTRQPSDILGPILPEIADRTGLAPTTPVYCGIHDSNASLLPHLLTREPPFSVVSTGTWVIAMAIGSKALALDPSKDTLVNVNALGDATPSARFMGGREFELLTLGQNPEPSETEVAEVLHTGTMFLPSVISGTGPFQGQAGRWIGTEPVIGTGRRSACVGFYLALVTARCLALIGSRGPICVEGPFAKNWCYLHMLNAATNRPIIAMASATGTSQGAALLGRDELEDGTSTCLQAIEELNQAMSIYAENWQSRIAE